MVILTNTTKNNYIIHDIIFFIVCKDVLRCFTVPIVGLYSTISKKSGLQLFNTFSKSIIDIPFGARVPVEGSNCSLNYS